MSTLTKLGDTGRIELIEVDLEPGEMRHRSLYGTADFMKWLSNALPSLPRDLDVQLNPIQQVITLFAEFISGTVIDYPNSLAELRPLENGIWEFRTRDIRVFGFFEKPNVFICAYGGTAKFCHDHNLYAGFRDQCIRVAKELGLTIVTGKKIGELT